MFRASGPYSWRTMPSKTIRAAFRSCLKKYPEAKLALTPKCKDMLVDHLHVAPERCITVADNQTLSLGNKTLQFIYAPWVHWPETMASYLKEDRILFTCDFFGSHLATSDLYVTDTGKVYEAAKRYYAEIMMPFRATITETYRKNRKPRHRPYRPFAWARLRRPLIYHERL